MSKDLQAIKDDLIRDYKSIYDPEIPVNIYDLGFIYDIRLEDKKGLVFCEVDMTLTSPGCSMADTLMDQITSVTKSHPDIEEAKINLVFDPPWTTELLSEEAREIMLSSGAGMFL